MCSAVSRHNFPSCGCSSQKGFAGALQPWEEERSTPNADQVNLHLCKPCGVMGKAKLDKNPLGYILVSWGHGHAERKHSLNFERSCDSGGIAHPAWMSLYRGQLSMEAVCDSSFVPFLSPTLLSGHKQGRKMYQSSSRCG